MSLLGMLNTELFSAERFKNIRRSVFYHYPNGAAPLTGLLSLLKEEDTDDPEFKWHEKRFNPQIQATAANAAAGPFADTSNVDLASPWTPALDDVVRVAVDAVSVFRVGHQVEIRGLTLNSGAKGNIQGVVTNVFSTTTPKRLEVRIIQVQTAILNTSANNAMQIAVVGSAFQQGGLDISSGIYNLPVVPYNYTQIFRSPFSITGTALKTSVKYDETGAYKDQAKESSVNHMIELEKAFLFGQRSVSIDPNSSAPTYTTGGLLWYLGLWEAGTTFGNTAATADSDDNKRIIANTAGTMSEKTYDGYLERLFRVTNNSTNEKLVLCGSGFLSVINQLYKSKAQLVSDLPMKDTYGMNVIKHLTPFGTIYYKTHPLFSVDASLRYNALYLDVHNLTYRYVQGRDTTLLTNRQPNDADYRKDEWLTEAGLEMHFPESHMYLQNVRDYTP